ncbi:hypothetical protein BK004_03180 [bacterium CG10_46_32]|nr:MAG: hypothetical protein BK004_03180 [bacterium CG10_46_32]PIR56000.1 MAG: hypothetical protein COU73_03215 [Parcubacteria group bacterium CG10_big_fil_rev_8_21_14_0_10_46_32]
MLLLNVLFAIVSAITPFFPTATTVSYLSNDAIRSDRAVSVTSSGLFPTKKDAASLGPRLSATSAIVVDAASGAVLFQKNPHKVWPMASITKLATALVFLDATPNAETLFTMEESDDREGGEEFIRPGESAKLRDFLIASLLGSANNATISLSRSVDPDMNTFVALMNKKASLLGMRDTVFTEPSGLSAENTSTAYDIVRLLAGVADYEAITASTGTNRAVITVRPSGSRRIVLTTNHLMGSIVFVEYGKTGHLDESLYNLATTVGTHQGHTLYIVTLGSETNEDRVQDAKNLAVWAENTYAWK